MRRKIVSVLLAVVITAAVVSGCSKRKDDSEIQDQEIITLKLFSNLPDRKTGQGLVEQMIIDEYMEENQNIKIQVEALDDEAYKTKFKAYAMEEMPDIVNIWGQPSFLDEIVEAGILAELNGENYAEYKFLEGSLDGFTYDGKLYGLPRNTDVQCIYYNQKIFQDNGWEIPATYDQLLDLAKEMNQAGIIPMAMDGGDGWPLAVYFSDLLYKLSGSECSDIINYAIETGDFSNENMQKAAELLKEAADAKLFQKGYDSQDYSTAINLFVNGQAAMFYMGSWEASMALNGEIPEEIRTNIRVFTMPVVEGGKGTPADIAAWNGGGYAVSADSKVKEEAIDFLNYMYRLDKLSKYGWENGVGMSAQDQSEYMTGEETELQQQIVDILNHAASVSGTPINDCGPSAFKISIESEIQGVSNGSLSIEDFLETIGNSCR